MPRLDLTTGERLIARALRSQPNLTAAELLKATGRKQRVGVERDLRFLRGANYVRTNTETGAERYCLTST